MFKIHRSAMFKMHRTHFAFGVVIAFTIGLASPADAVTELGWGYANRDTPGTSWIELSPHNSSFCALTNVQVEETDGTNEYVYCFLHQHVGGNWILYGRVNSGNAKVKCSAYCYSF